MPAQGASDYTPPFSGYWVSAVGFINVAVPSGHSLVSAQLVSYYGPAAVYTDLPNVVTNVFAFASSNGLAVTKIRADGRLGSSYYTPRVGWTETSMTLLPGEGAVLWNAGAPFTNTIVGSVLQGALTNELPAGLTLCSSSVPQAGRLTSDLQFPAAFGDVVFFLNSDGTYRRYDYWATGWHPEEPVVRLSEAFWSRKAAPTNWVRLFAVNQAYVPYIPTYSIRSFAVGPEVTTNLLHRAIPYLPLMPGQVHVASSRQMELRAAAVNQVGAAYQWQRNGASLTDGPRLTGSRSDTLVVTGLQQGVDDGIYTVMATNTSGIVVAHAADLQVVSAASEAPTFDQPVKTTNTVDHTLRVQPGKFYRVQTSSDLRVWNEVTNFTSTGSTFPLSLPAPTDGVRLFYRLASP